MLYKCTVFAGIELCCTTQTDSSNCLLIVYAVTSTGLHRDDIVVHANAIWLILSGCGAKRIGTGFESHHRMFVEVVHIQGSKLFKYLECAVLSMILCTNNY